MNQPYYRNKESVEEYIRLAKDINGAEHIEKLKAVLAGGSTLLELGTGPGSDWNILKNDYRVVGSDNSQEFLDHLRAKNPEGRFLSVDAAVLEIDETFDGIYSNKVLHHLKDEELIYSVKRQSDILNVGGIICHTFWAGEGAEEFKGMFVNYHRAAQLRDFFESHFEILKLEPYQEFEKDDSLLLIAIARPNGE